MEKMLGKLRREYLLCKPPQQCKYLKSLLSNFNSASAGEDEEIQGQGQVNKVFKETLGRGEGGSCRQPPIQYRFSFAKFIIKELENSVNLSEKEDLENENEILEVFYNYLEELSKEKQLSEPFYRLYDISKEGDEETLVKFFENDKEIVSEGTTGLVTWEASLQFIKFLNSSTPFLPEVNWVIEVGSGCGLLGISFLKLSSSSSNSKLSKYIATDGNDLVLDKCRVNIEDNLPNDPRVDFEILDWTSPKDLEKFERIVSKYSKDLGLGCLIGADIVFDPSLIPFLVKFIQSFILIQKENRNCSGNAILSCTIRNEETLKTLLERLDSTSKLKLTKNVIFTWKNGFILEISQSVSN